MGVTPEEIRAFLDRSPAVLGVVGTLRRDGSPHLTPVWYRYDGAAIHIWTGEHRIWVKQIRRDNRVAFSVQEEQPPHAAVVMHGRAEVLTARDERVLAEIRAITRRYVGEAGVEEYIGDWGDLWTIVTIRPETMAWRRSAAGGKDESGVIRSFTSMENDA